MNILPIIIISSALITTRIPQLKLFDCAFISCVSKMGACMLSMLRNSVSRGRKSCPRLIFGFANRYLLPLLCFVTWTTSRFQARLASDYYSTTGSNNEDRMTRPSSRNSQQQIQNVRSTMYLTYGLVVVRCRENTAWLEEVPSWFSPVVVYEKCGQRIHNHSWAIPNLGHEEASGYLHYLVNYYDVLPDVTFFLQSDAFTGQPYGNPKRGYLGHTIFSNFTQLWETTQSLMPSSNGYLRFGRYYHPPPYHHAHPHHLDSLDHSRNKTIWLVDSLVQSPEDPYSYIGSESLLRTIFQLSGVASSRTTSTTRIDFAPGACMAVSRQRLHHQPVQVYQQLLDTIHQSASQQGHARRWACALERTWHVVFGSSSDRHLPYELVPRPSYPSTISHPPPQNQ